MIEVCRPRRNRHLLSRTAAKGVTQRSVHGYTWYIYIETTSTFEDVVCFSTLFCHRDAGAQRVCESHKFVSHTRPRLLWLRFLTLMEAFSDLPLNGPAGLAWLIATAAATLCMLTARSKEFRSKVQTCLGPTIGLNHRQVDDLRANGCLLIDMFIYCYFLWRQISCFFFSSFITSIIIIINIIINHFLFSYRILL